MVPVAVLVTALVLGVILAFVIPIVSRRRGVTRAAAAGARWSGLANFEASESGQAPVVADALRGVGKLYGASQSARDRRPVGGVLFVASDRLWWEPRIWLGRGKARPWQLPAGAVRDVIVERDPLPVVRSYRATLHTDGGDIRFVVADPDGLREAIASLPR